MCKIERQDNRRVVVRAIKICAALIAVILICFPPCFELDDPHGHIFFVPLNEVGGWVGFDTIPNFEYLALELIALFIVMKITIWIYQKKQ